MHIDSKDIMITEMEKVKKSVFRRLLRWMVSMALIISAGVTNSQVITFKKVIGGPRTDSARDIEVCSNGDYLIVGISTSYSQGDSDIYVLRTDKYGKELWKKTIGGFGEDMAQSIDKTDDGNFIIAGFTTSIGAGSYDIYVLKIDENANVIWSKTYGGTGWDVAREVRHTSDGGFIVTGYSNSGPSANFDAFLLKLDDQGSQQWIKYYGGTLYESAYSVKELPQGGYIMLGSTFTYGIGNGDFYLIKTNAAGDTLWTRTAGGPANEEGQFVTATADGGYIMMGDQESYSQGDYDVSVRKFDMNGNEVWSKLFGGTQKDVGKMIQPTHDGGYVLSAITRSFGLDNPDFWMIKIDAAGNKQWDKSFGGKDHEHCYVIKQTDDGGYIAAGHTDSAPSIGIDVYLVKTDSAGKVASPVGVPEKTISAPAVSVYPNPASERITLGFSNAGPEQYNVRLINVAGQIIINKLVKVSEAGEQITLDCSSFPKGLYLLEFTAGSERLARKVMLQ